MEKDLNGSCGKYRGKVKEILILLLYLFFINHQEKRSGNKINFGIISIIFNLNYLLDNIKPKPINYRKIKKNNSVISPKTNFFNILQK